MEERLDELLGKAREVGRLNNEAARLEHAAARRLAREACKARDSAEVQLAVVRSRFLASLPAEGSAS